MNNISLIIDGNWLLMSRLSVVKQDSSLCKNVELLMDKVDSLMIKSIKLVLKTFPLINNIIFVMDFGSWRRHLLIPEFLIDTTYKGNRERTSDIDWTIIFKRFDEFGDYLKSNYPITVSREHLIEGDDWCWYWSKKLNSLNYNCIIWTRDRDITQLTNVNEGTGIFTIIWSKESGVIINEKYYKSDITQLLFNNTLNKNDKILQEIIKNASFKVTKINPQNLVIDKIIRGDLGDNIKPILTRTVGNRQFRVSSKNIPSQLNIFDDNQIKGFIDNILNSKPFSKENDKNKEEIYEHFLYNRALVYLDKSSYPDEIKNIFNNYTEMPKIISNTNSFLSINNDIKDIIDEL